MTDVYHAMGGALVRKGRPDRTPTEPMLLGAFVDSNTASVWNAREAEVGAMGIRRSYDPGFNTDFMAGPAASDVGQGRVSWTSVKPDVANTASGALDSQITAYANSIPADHPLMLTFQHEPENPSKGINPAAWRSAFARFYDLVKAVRPNVLIGPILMAWTFDPASGRTVSDWNVGAGNCDFYGVDEYNDYHFPATGNGASWSASPSARVSSGFQNLCDSLGVPGAVGEIASAEDATGIGPQRKIDWTQAYIDFGHAHDWLAICWFDVHKAGDTDATMVLDSTPQFVSYWQSRCAAHPARTLPAP